ncbi:restriction endonuclease subunit S [Vibrio parahaemolyticus]|nr:restriction endonuclease subunit S [Vibrio parahaemolyticus]EHQ9268563.1 restriction endonuclease subunit S [Vibrio parahaemolyticus]EJE8517020.1 restriction endonuclease subunit S [Vibrio parahaemolyticus]EJL6379257.1 restriction endonuclease subunit S [Vibrio parahaemolyticus]ELA7005231.1 restriction endonuclease subunit S [Vibrio parahaemolyticus]
MGFEVKSIGEVCSVGDGAHSKVTRVETGIPYLTSKNIGQGFLKLDKLDYISEESFEKLFSKDSKATRRPQAGDVLFGIIGSFGNTYLYKESDFFGFSSSIGILRPNPELLDSEYLYYVVSSKKFRDNHANHNSGSVQGYTNIPTVKGLPLPVPSIAVQKKIAKVLQSLDRKIAVNQQTNQTLEAMAQAIFKSWFVDFDPVKAKMRGEQPEGMDEATASLFPEKLVESELGLIPEGWEAVQIGDIVERLKPKKRYTKKQVEPYGKTPVYEQGASILLGFHNDDAGFDASPEEPVFIFGDHTCITHLSCSKFDISSNVIPLKGSIRPTIWTYYAIQGKQEFQEYRRHWSEFIIKGVVLPPIELAEKYAELVTTNYLMMESLKRQSKELEQLRDTLLPKLLSGEIELETEKEQ